MTWAGKFCFTLPSSRRSSCSCLLPAPELFSATSTAVDTALCLLLSSSMGIGSVETEYMGHRTGWPITPFTRKGGRGWVLVDKGYGYYSGRKGNYTACTAKPQRRGEGGNDARLKKRVSPLGPIGSFEQASFNDHHDNMLPSFLPWFVCDARVDWVGRQRIELVYPGSKTAS